MGCLDRLGLGFSLREDLQYYISIIARVDCIMDVNRQNVLGGQRALLVGLTRLVWDDVYKKDADLCVDSPPTLQFAMR